MEYEYLETEEQLRELCRRLSDASVIGFDTEFVSEDTYRPELCLIQVAAGGTLAVIDTMKIRDVTPFWECIAAPGHETIVHAGREEFLFCLRSTGRQPTGLFDLQLAAGLVGMEYPAAYGTLILRLLGKKLSKGETRTDWRRRPLSERQIEYALQDVVFLEPMRRELGRRLEKLGRTDWLAWEMRGWQDELESVEGEERWRRVSGMSGLSHRALAIVRELWRWREQESARRNQPPRRVLRDDLIVELARRGSDDLKRIKALRGMERGDLRPHLEALAACVTRALEQPEEELPRTTRREMPKQITVLGQFLGTALNSLCHSLDLAPSLVGTAQDVRDLVAYRLEIPGFAEEPPLLAQGWRAEVVGKLIDDLLAGKLAIRIRDPLSEEPLAFEP